MIQCATCLHEPQAREGYASLHPEWSQTMTNISLMDYQKFARRYRCGDYFRAHQSARPRAGEHQQQEGGVSEV